MATVLGWIGLGIIIGAVLVVIAAMWLGSNVERDTEQTRAKAAQMAVTDGEDAA